MGWDTIYKSFGEVEKTQNIIPTLFLSFIGKGKIVLDLGCGTGRHSLYLAKEGYRVISVDQSFAALSILRKRITKLLLQKNIIRVKKGLLTKIPLGSNSVDGIVCIKTLSHGMKEDIRDSIKEMKRVLKKDGLLFTDLLSKKDSDFDKERFTEIVPGTMMGLPHEEKIPHYFVEKKDIKHYFSGFQLLEVKETSLPASSFRRDKNQSIVYRIIARK